MGLTTVQLKTETLKRLKAHKTHERESYDELLNSLLDESEEEPLTREEIEEIKQGLEDVKKGRVESLEKVAAEFGVKL
jgi:predicted transcriptional regulator